MLAFKLFMETAMLAFGVGKLMKFIVHPVQILVNSFVFPRIVIGKGRGCYHEQSRQRQGGQQGFGE